MKPKAAAPVAMSGKTKDSAYYNMTPNGPILNPGMELTPMEIPAWVADDAPEQSAGESDEAEWDYGQPDRGKYERFASADDIAPNTRLDAAPEYSVLKNARVLGLPSGSMRDAIDGLVSEYRPDEYVRTKHEARMAELYGWDCDGAACRVPERLTLKMAAEHYMQGGSKSVIVPGKYVDLSYIERSKIDNVLSGRSTGLEASWGMGAFGLDVEDRYVYGSVKAYPDGKGGLRLSDTYDFDTKLTVFRNRPAREFATLIGGGISRILGGPIKNGPLINLVIPVNPFKIYFSGSVPVPSYPVNK